MPKDKNGHKHIIGLFELDGEYKEFKTLGAKKYAYIDKKDELHITVSGVPKEGSKALKNLDDFRNDFIFDFKYTNKNMLAYNDDMQPFLLKDYEGVEIEVSDKFGCSLIPITYKLGISEEYAELLSDESSKHSIFRE